MARTQQSQSNNLLSLDDAARRLDVSRQKLRSFVQALDIQTQRGSDRRSYLTTQDVERIQSWQESKVNPAFAGLTLMSNTPTPISMPRNYKNYIQEGYRGEPTTYKCVNYITTNGGAIPPKLYTDRTMQKTIDKHSLLDKLDRPNLEQSGVEYRESVLGYLLIAGNSYQYAIRKGINGPPDELWALEPDKIAIIPDKKRGIVGYEYSDFERDKNTILPQNIGRMRFWAPDSPLYGLSPVELAAILIDMQTSSRKWNLALLQNYAKPPGAWVFDGILDVNTRKKVKEALNLEMAGYRNAGKVPVLDGGFKWVPSSTSPSEMDWLEAMRYNAANIANIFNIAPQLIGDTSATTYNNMEEAKAASYTEAIFPALDKLYSLWNTWLVPMYPDLKGAYLYYDKQTVEVVQTVIQTRLSAATDRANKSWMQGSCTLNEAREQQGLPPLPGGDVFRFGNVLVRASELDKYAEQSLQTPAAPPMPVPENILDTPQETPTPQPQTQENEEQPPKKPVEDEEKSRKWNIPDSVWTPTDLAKRLDEYKAQGVTHLTWHLGARLHHCNNCKDNDGQTVKLGDPFPSKALLPPQHPDCDCEVEPSTRKQQLIQVTRKAAKVVLPSVEERIADLQARGITHLQWVLGINCCHECMVNSGVTVKAGDPFPSGILLPPQCPDCQCTVIEHIQSEPKIIDTKRDKKRAREEFRDFMGVLR